MMYDDENADKIFHLDVHYVCYIMLVQRFEPQGSRFKIVHYCYNDVNGYIFTTSPSQGYTVHVVS